jgi:hypothetical protein
MHARVATVRRHTPPPPPLQPPEPEAALLQSLGRFEVEDSILIIGKSGLDLMCALLRAGAAQVTHLCSHEHPDPNSTGLAIVPQAPSLDWLANTIPSLRRALHANGRLVACIAIQPTVQPTAQHTLRRLLALHGFASVRVRTIRGGCLVQAELPSFGLRHVA